MRVLNNKMTFLILSEKEIVRDIERAVYTPPIRAEATLEWEVMYLKGKIAIKSCSWR